MSLRYSPPRPGPWVDLDLSRNEGTPPSRSLIDDVANESELMGRYPNVEDLRARLADLNRVPPDRVQVTAGADDALFRCLLAFGGRTRTIAATTPSFEMIDVYTAQLGGRVESVPWWGGSFPVEAFTATANGADLAIVVSPNNPTGAAIDERDLEQLAARVPFLVLDAAYEEFAEHPLTEIALRFENVVVLRTLSKAWGLAGLRVGYALGASDAISRISSYGSPYAVSGLSAALAASILEDRGELAVSVAGLRARRRALSRVLTGLGANPFPSQANFVLASFPDAEWVASVSRSLGIGLRRFPGRPGLESHLRLTVPGSEQALGRLVHALQSALAPQALIFDVDGVLADVSSSQTSAIIAAAGDLGVDLDPIDIAEAKTEGNANDDWELTRRLCSRAGIEVSLQDATARYEFHYQGNGGRVGLKDREELNVDPRLLRRWAERMPIGVVTGRPRADTEEFLRRFGIADLMSAVVTREDAPLKPSPEPVRTAMQQLGVRVAWMLGDTPDDVLAARDAAVVPIGVVAPGDDPEATRSALIGAAVTLDRVDDLDRLLS